MSRHFRKFKRSSADEYQGQRPFQHWYRDNTVYFITSRCRDKFPAFDSDEAQFIFWDRFYHWTTHYGFVPWITTLMNNHYHTLGYLKVGENLGPMMQRLHGSVAKLVNDTLPERHLPFWITTDQHDYFDGCIRDELQCRRAYRYVMNQSVRAKLVKDWNEYANTKVVIDVERGVKRAHELKAFMEGVPYARYDHR